MTQETQIYCTWCCSSVYWHYCYTSWGKLHHCTVPFTFVCFLHTKNSTRCHPCHWYFLSESFSQKPSQYSFELLFNDLFNGFLCFLLELFLEFLSNLISEFVFYHCYCILNLFSAEASCSAKNVQNIICCLTEQGPSEVLYHILSTASFGNCIYTWSSYPCPNSC